MTDRNTGALAGIDVVELGEGIAAPYCAWLLGALGASVTKVESPAGDPLRSHGRASEDVGGLFAFLDRGKRHVRLDLSRPEDAAELTALAGHSSIFIEDLGAGELERRGVDVAAIRAAGSVVTRLSPFGQDGPLADRPASELVLQAMGGWVTSRNMPGSPPVQVGGRLSEFVHGVYAAAGALTALRGRSGAVADVSALESVHSAFPPPTVYERTLRQLGRGSVKAQHRPLDVVACRDGWVGINLLTAQQWMDVCALMGLSEFEDEWADLKQGGPRLTEFEQRSSEWLEQRTSAEIIEICQAFRIPSVPIGNGQTMPTYAQWMERPFFREIRIDEREALGPGFPWRLGGTPAGAAAIDGSTDAAPGWPVRDAAASDLPLAGLRVVDLASFWAGSYFTCYLGAFGADVVKVESIQRPDGFRYGKTFRELGADWFERGGPWRATNHNKKDLTLDLGTEEGRELVRRLIRDADVVAENYSARVIEEFGLGYEELRELNPRLVMVRMPGFGLAGPWRDYVGWGNAFEQISGAAWVTGHEDGPPSTPGGYADPIVGMHAAVATLAALRHRDRTGEGQLVEVPQIEVIAVLAAEQVISRSLTGQTSGRTGNRRADLAPQGVYRGADDRWWAMSVRDDADWERFAAALGNPDWTQDHALSGLAGRQQAHVGLDAHIAHWATQRSAADAEQILAGAGIPVCALPEPLDYLDNPQLRHRGYYQTMEHPVTGSEPYPGWPVRITPGPVDQHRFVAPTLGQHNDELLTERLGLSADDIESMRRRRITGTVPLGLAAEAGR